MTIGQMITALERLKEKHGDLPVFVNDGGRREWEVGAAEYQEYDEAYDANKDEVVDLHPDRITLSSWGLAPA